MDYPFLNTDYLKVPNYERATEVEAVDAAALNQRSFRADYVDRNRPVLVRQAASHWPACERWQSIDYLKSKCGEAVLDVHSAPVIEADGLISSPEKRAWLKMLFLTRAPKRLSFAEFLDRATVTTDADSDADELFFLYSVPLRPGGPLAALREDVGAYAFHERFNEAIYATYPRNNAFFYRSSLTDWHYHHTAEALQTQVLGTKEVLLLPPGDRVWSYMFALHSKRLHLYDCESADYAGYPEAERAVPLRAVLQPGDALYIPAFWWHFVSTRGHRSLGATVPTWWRTPLHVQCDLRFAANRAALSAMLHGQMPWRQSAVAVPALLAGSMLGQLRRLARPDVLHRA
jgi:hypothetical protein